MLEELINERRKKLDALRKAKIDPYPARVKRTATIAEVRADFKKLLASKKKLFVAGRLMSIRDQGGVAFADLHDESGQIQILLKKDTLEKFEFIKPLLDRGDFISVGGTALLTKRGEESIEAQELEVLTKSLRPLPTEWYGVEDDELRLRERYVDLALNDEVRELFRKKARFWSAVRDFLKKEDFLEVETGVLEPIPGGAEAEPFVTHHNALDEDFYLRISLELPLKKLMVGGYEKVFEIGRIFRNEGIDRDHLQDYTQMECYWAYHDYGDMMAMTEKMYKRAIKEAAGGLVTEYQGHKINWGKKWGKVDYVKAFRDASGIDPASATRGELLAKAKSLGLAPEGSGRGRVIDLIYKKTVRPKLIQPCFLIDPPVDIEPLAKRSPKNPKVVERFQIVACGTELGKGFTELNDPLDQRTRFEEQMKLRAAGDKEAQQLDEDFLRALEYGMPPAAGFGMSERLFAVLMDKPMRETVFFPLMRSK